MSVTSFDSEVTQKLLKMSMNELKDAKQLEVVYAGMPTPLSHAYLAGAFAAGAPSGLVRGDLEPHRDLVIMGTTAYSFEVWWWAHSVGASATARGHQKRARACTLWFPRPPLGWSIFPRKPPASAHGAAGRYKPPAWRISATCLVDSFLI